MRTPAHSRAISSVLMIWLDGILDGSSCLIICPLLPRSAGNCARFLGRGIFPGPALAGCPAAGMPSCYRACKATSELIFPVHAAFVDQYLERVLRRQVPSLEVSLSCGKAIVWSVARGFSSHIPQSSANPYIQRSRISRQLESRNKGHSIRSASDHLLLARPDDNLSCSTDRALGVGAGTTCGARLVRPA